MASSLTLRWTIGVGLYVQSGNNLRIYREDIDSEMNFDENNKEFMDALAASMITLVPHRFPSEIQVGDSQLSLNYDAEAPMDSRFKCQLIDIIDQCLGDLYLKNKGDQWKEEKREEFDTPGLVFVWYERDQKPVCFISFMICEETYGQCLYLYEIHVLPEVQNESLGKSLLENFHSFSKHLNTLSTLPDLQHFQNSFTALTVFTANERALSWYRKYGYELTEDSPEARVTRSGKQIKPEYYLLYKRWD